MKHLTTLTLSFLMTIMLVLLLFIMPGTGDFANERSEILTPNLTEPISATYPEERIFPALSEIQPEIRSLSSETDLLETVTVTFRFIDGIISGEVPVGTVPICPSPTAFLVSGAASYTFAGWEPAIGTVNANTVYTARYILQERDESIVAALTAPLLNEKGLEQSLSALSVLWNNFCQTGETNTDLFERLCQHLISLSSVSTKDIAHMPHFVQTVSLITEIADSGTFPFSYAYDAKQALDGAASAFLKDNPNGADLLFTAFLYHMGLTDTISDYTAGNEYTYGEYRISEPGFLSEALLLLTSGGVVTGSSNTAGYPGAFTSRSVSYENAKNELISLLPILTYFEDENIYSISNYPYVAARLYVGIDDLYSNGGSISDEDDSLIQKIFLGIDDGILSHLEKANVYTFETGTDIPAFLSQSISWSILADPNVTAGDGKYLSLLEAGTDDGSLLVSLFPQNYSGHTYVISFLAKGTVGDQFTVSIKGNSPESSSYRQKTFTINEDDTFSLYTFTVRLDSDYLNFDGTPYLAFSFEGDTKSLSVDNLTYQQNDSASVDPLLPGQTQTVYSSYKLIGDYSKFSATLYTPFLNGSSMKSDPQTSGFTLNSKTEEFTPETYATWEFDYYYYQSSTNATFYLRSGYQNTKNDLFTHSSDGIVIGAEKIKPDIGWHRFAVEVMQTYSFNGNSVSYRFKWNLYIDGVYVGSSEDTPQTTSSDIVLLYKASKDNDGTVTISRSDYNAYFYIYVSGGEGYMHVKNIHTGISTAKNTFGEVVVPVEYDLSGGAFPNTLSFTRAQFTAGSKTYAALNYSGPEVYRFYVFAKQNEHELSAISPTMTLPETPVKNGYSFSKWSFDTTGISTYSDSSLNGYPIKLYAVWEKQ